MRPVLCLLALPVVLGVAACTVSVPTNPHHYDIEANALSRLRAPQAVVLSNAYPGEANATLKLRGAELVLDQKQLTDTAIAMLSRAMEKQNIAVSAEAPKSIALRVRVRGVRMQPFRWTGIVILEAQFGDGTSTSIPNENLSGLGWEEAFDGAVLLALNDLAENEKFVAYMNR